MSIQLLHEKYKSLDYTPDLIKRLNNLKEEYPSFTKDDDSKKAFSSKVIAEKRVLEEGVQGVASDSTTAALESMSSEKKKKASESRLSELPTVGEVLEDLEDAKAEEDSDDEDD